jgi:hypothetical protein
VQLAKDEIRCVLCGRPGAQRMSFTPEARQLIVDKFGHSPERFSLVGKRVRHHLPRQANGAKNKETRKVTPPQLSHEPPRVYCGALDYARIHTLIYHRQPSYWTLIMNLNNRYLRAHLQQAWPLPDYGFYLGNRQLAYVVLLFNKTTLPLSQLIWLMPLVEDRRELRRHLDYRDIMVFASDERDYVVGHAIVQRIEAEPCPNTKQTESICTLHAAKR